MYDESRSLSATLPLGEEDFTKWTHRRANSLTLEIPQRTPADLIPLTELDGLAHLHIGGDSRGLVTLGSVLPSLTGLQSLAVNLPKYSISDFPPRLRELRLTPYRSGVELSGLNLKSLWVDGLRGVGDLNWLNGASINRLAIQHAPDLSSLVGIPESVSSLRADFAPRLSDLGGLRGLCLRSVKLHQCGDLRLPPEIERCVVELLINECGKVATLSSLAGARALRRLEFYGSTEIEDGRVAFLSELPNLVDVRFQNRKTYDSTREEIWVHLSKGTVQ